MALSIGLAMDAFAVSLVRGSVGDRRLVRALELGFAFGLAQGIMPLIGWGLGWAFAGSFKFYDHWIAFLLLGLLGGRMLFEALTGDDDDGVISSHSRFLGLAVAAFATSIDAAAAGLTLALLDTTVPVSCLIIGCTTAALCTLGYWLGGRVSRRGRKVSELVGGLVLIGLGTRILFDHLSS